MIARIVHIAIPRGAARALRVAFCLCVIFVLAPAQQIDLATKIRLAQSFEQAGEWERAASIYESLLESNPRSFVILEGLRRSYTELKQYDKAMELVRQQLQANPGDENLLSILGGLYDLAGETQKADSLWQVVIGRDVKNPNLYRLVAAQLIDHRQYDKAIQIYRQGRQATNNQNLFVEELASLYGALHQYASATREYVKILRLNSQQVNYVQSRLSSFTASAEGRQAALGVVKQEVDQTPEQVPLHTILAWLCMEGKDYDAALDQYRIIDRLTKANGYELFQFGQRASQEHAYRVAARAFREVIDQKSEKNIIPFARFGYVRAVEELSAENDTVAQTAGVTIAPPTGGWNAGRVSETEPTFQGALALYESIISDYPNTEIAMQALFRIGTIRFDRFFDLNGAVSAFEQARVMPFSSTVTQEATLSLAEVQTARNDLNLARREYNQLLTTAREQYRDRVLYRLAELDYFEAQFDSASAMLQRISSNVANDLTNDALQLLYFIKENTGAGQAALTSFAHADLLKRQRKYSEALALFESVVTQFPATSLVDDATMRMGELQLLLDHPDDALAVFRKVANDMPTSILRDRAQMRIAEVYEKTLKNKQKAIEAYERLLENYPTSLYVEAARKRIRILRGDSN